MAETKKADKKTKTSRKESTNEPASQETFQQIRIHRSTTDRVIGGVAGGLAQYFNIDSTIIRLLFVLITIFGGSGILIYFILWLIIPGSEHTSPMEDTIRKNAQEMRLRASTFTTEISPGKHPKDTKVWIGLIIILIGITFLLNNFGFSINIGRLWPVWLIALGLFLLFK